MTETENSQASVRPHSAWRYGNVVGAGSLSFLWDGLESRVVRGEQAHVEGERDDVVERERLSS